MPPRPIAPFQGGFVLLIVLWALGMLALLGTQLAGTARAQLRLAEANRDHASAEAAADAGIRQAMFVLLSGGQIDFTSKPMRIMVATAVVDVLAEDEAAKLNPNTASRDVLRGLLAAVGVDQPHAARLAGEIADWRIRSPVSVLGGQKIDLYRDRGLPYRSGDHAFYSVDELGLVPDMTQDILRRLRPWVSVYHEGDVNDPAGTSPAAVATGDVRISSKGGAGPGFVSRNVIVHLTATAVLPGGARFVRSAVVRVRATPDDTITTTGDLIQVLTWE